VQDEEVGDGTTSVIILSGEMLVVAEPFLLRNMHPTQIVGGYNQALQTALKVCEEISMTVDTTDREKMNEGTPLLGARSFPQQVSSLPFRIPVFLQLSKPAWAPSSCHDGEILCAILLWTQR
jgi:chaperonin GroEL (HSP60 family)